MIFRIFRTSMPIRRENMKTSKRRKKEKGSDSSRCHGGNVLVNNFYFYVRKRIRSTTHFRIYVSLRRRRRRGRNAMSCWAMLLSGSWYYEAWIGTGNLLKFFHGWPHIPQPTIPNNTHITHSYRAYSVKAGNNYIHIIMCVIYFTILRMQIEIWKLNLFGVLFMASSLFGDERL